MARDDGRVHREARAGRRPAARRCRLERRWARCSSRSRRALPAPEPRTVGIGPAPLPRGSFHGTRPDAFFDAARLGRELRRAGRAGGRSRGRARGHGGARRAPLGSAKRRAFARRRATRAPRAAEREAAERDDVRERLRKLGLWRLITKLGLDVRVSEPSMCAMRAWLEAARRRARADGRAPPLFFNEGVFFSEASGGARAKSRTGYADTDAETNGACARRDERETTTTTTTTKEKTKRDDALDDSEPTRARRRRVEHAPVARRAAPPRRDDVDDAFATANGRALGPLDDDGTCSVLSYSTLKYGVRRDRCERRDSSRRRRGRGSRTKSPAARGSAAARDEGRET